MFTSIKIIPTGYKKNKKQCAYKRTIDARSRNHCCSGKNNKYYIFWVCVGLVIQHAKRMRHITLSCVVCPAVSHFSTGSHKRRDLTPKM